MLNEEDKTEEPSKMTEDPDIASYSEEDFEVLANTFGKGANKRKMLVTKGITLKKLYEMSDD